MKAHVCVAGLDQSHCGTCGERLLCRLYWYRPDDDFNNGKRCELAHGHAPPCGAAPSPKGAPAWRMVRPGFYRLLTLERVPRVLGEARRSGSKWLAFTDNMNGTGYADTHDAKTLKAAQAWVEKHGR